MKSKVVVFILFFFSGVVIVMLSGNSVLSDETGAPSQTTGSPADGQTCAKSNCHTGSAVQVTPGIMTTNIPAAGYVPGSTYTITATLSQSGISCWGFEISPQAYNGALLGTPVITNTTQTKIVSSKYVTHKLAGITGANNKTWTFNWVAPAAGTGAVTFYGAFNYCNGNGSKSGDVIHTSTLDVNEFTTSTAEVKNAEKTFTVYPNPVLEDAELSVYLNEPTDIRMTMYSVNGGTSKVIAEEKQVSGSYIYNLNRSDLSSGIYIVNLETKNGITSKKFVVL